MVLPRHFFPQPGCAGIKNLRPCTGLSGIRATGGESGAERLEISVLFFFVAHATFGQFGFRLLVTAAALGMAHFLEGIVFGVHIRSFGVMAGFTLGDLLSFHVGCLFPIRPLAVVAFSAVEI